MQMLLGMLRKRGGGTTPIARGSLETDDEGELTSLRSDSRRAFSFAEHPTQEYAALAGWAAASAPRVPNPSPTMASLRPALQTWRGRLLRGARRPICSPFPHGPLTAGPPDEPTLARSEARRVNATDGGWLRARSVPSGRGQKAFCQDSFGTAVGPPSPQMRHSVCTLASVVPAGAGRAEDGELKADRHCC